MKQYDWFSQRNNRGACLVGCLIAIIAVFLVIIGLSASAYFGFKHLIEQYTETSPRELPEITFSKAEADDLKIRIEDFNQQLEKGEPAGPLTLTENELNNLIQTHPDWIRNQGNVYVTLKKDEISGEISLDLGKSGIPFTEGRYFNGSAKFNVYMKDRQLHVYFRSLEVKGKSVPETIVKQLENNNLAADPQKDPKAKAWMDKIESITIEDGKITLVPWVNAQEGGSGSDKIDLAPPAK